MAGRTEHGSQPGSKPSTLHAIAMDIQTYQKYWQDKGEILYKFSTSSVDKTKVDEITFTFLTTCGLPFNVAPSLSFNELKEDRFLTPNQIFKIDFDELTNYLMFGSNGSGDPICIDKKTKKEIVYLNHDNYFDRVFINSDILMFAASLTEFNKFISSLIIPTSLDYSLRKFSDNEFSDLQTGFQDIDKYSLSDNSFWKTELDYLLIERDAG